MCVCVYLMTSSEWSGDSKLSLCVCYLFSQNIQNKPTNHIVRERRHVRRRVAWSTRCEARNVTRKHSPASPHQNKVCSRQSHSACRSTKSSAIKDFTWLIIITGEKKNVCLTLFHCRDWKQRGVVSEAAVSTDHQHNNHKHHSSLMISICTCWHANC